MTLIGNMPTKNCNCTRCGINLFHVNNRTKYCLDCRKIEKSRRTRLHKIKYKKRYSEYKKKYEKENPDIKRECDKRYREKHKEKIKIRRKEYDRRYCNTEKGKINLQKKRYIHTCKNCNKNFKSNNKTSIFCSVNCRFIYCVGENSPKWKGGKTSINRRIRSSKKYRNWRYLIFIRDNYTCQYCHERGVELHPHHIKSFAKYPNDRFDINNGITLCSYCHKLVHSLKPLNQQ